MSAPSAMQFDDIENKENQAPDSPLLFSQDKQQPPSPIRTLELLAIMDRLEGTNQPEEDSGTDDDDEIIVISDTEDDDVVVEMVEPAVETPQKASTPPVRGDTDEVMSEANFSPASIQEATITESEIKRVLQMEWDQIEPREPAVPVDFHWELPELRNCLTPLIEDECLGASQVETTLTSLETVELFGVKYLQATAKDDTMVPSYLTDPLSPHLLPLNIALETISEDQFQDMLLWDVGRAMHYRAEQRLAQKCRACFPLLKACGHTCQTTAKEAIEDCFSLVLSEMERTSGGGDPNTPATFLFPEDSEFLQLQAALVKLTEDVGVHRYISPLPVNNIYYNRVQVRDRILGPQNAYEASALPLEEAFQQIMLGLLDLNEERAKQWGRKRKTITTAAAAVRRHGNDVCRLLGVPKHERPSLKANFKL